MLKIQGAQMEKCPADKKPIFSVITYTAIHIIIDGFGYLGNERLGRGQGFVTYRNDLVNYYPDSQQPWTYFWFRLSGEDTDRILSKTVLPTRSGSFSVENPNEIIRLAKALLDGAEYAERNSLYAESVAGLLLSLLMPPSEALPQVSVPEQYVTAAKHYIQENYFYGIGVSDVARAVNINRKYLCAIFQRYAGMSTMDYLIQIRIERAKVLLEQDSWTINLIATAVGYRDPLLFSRIFKKYVGISPSEYRQQRRNRVEPVLE